MTVKRMLAALAMLPTLSARTETAYLAVSVSVSSG